MAVSATDGSVLNCALPSKNR